MTEDELGRMSTHELEMHPNQPEVELEIGERWDVFNNGKPGVSPLLSRRVVRETLSRIALDELSEGGGEYAEGFFRGWRACREACARALLALSNEDPIPWEDES